VDTGTETQSIQLAGRREWLGLVVLSLPTLLVSVDLSVLYLALPRLAAALRPSGTQQLWILDIYGFMVAGFLVTMGTLGDRIGRKKLLLIGTAVFGAASAVAAYAANPGMLIGARTVLGIAGATLAPCTLALISTMFKHPKQRGAAVSVWMSCFMGGGVLGPIVGGALLANFWWGSVFLIAVPVMLLLLVAGPILLPEFRNPQAGRLDLASVALSLAAILPVIYAITEAARTGWRPLHIAAIVAGVVFAVIFVARQRRLADPLLDLSLFSNRTYRSAFVLSMLGGALQGGSFLLVSLYLQMVDGYSPLRSGLFLVPAAFAMVVTIMLSAGLARQFRPAYIMAGGLVVSAVGYLLLSQLSSTGGLLLLVVGWGIATAGIGPATALGYDMILGSAPPEKAGSASAIVETGGQAGVAMGIALLGSIGAAIYRSHIVVPAAVPARAAAAAHDSITGAVAVAYQLPASLGIHLLHAAREAFTSGLHTVAVVGAVVFVAMAVLTAAALRHVAPSAQPQPQAAGAPEAATAEPPMEEAEIAESLEGSSSGR
jgi:DHA2 family multidrug resistance protein-like MFS transporter